MKKALLAGVAALLMATSAAHALPDGSICAVVNLNVGATIETLEEASPAERARIMRRRDGKPDHLNLREKPNARSKIKMKILAGNVLILDKDPTMDLFKNWIYVTSAISVDGGGEVHIEDGPGWYGWAAAKHLKLVECPKPQETQPGDIRPEDLG